MTVLSISKLKALASIHGLISSAGISIAVQNVWSDFAARHQLKTGPDQGPDLLRTHRLNLKVIVIPPSLSRYDAEEINETCIRQRRLARKDLFKNAHMKASSRFKKRGDGELSRGYSLLTKAVVPRSHSSKHDLTVTSSLVDDIVAAKSHREMMYQHFWEAHKRRKDNVASQAGKEETRPRLSPAVREDKHRLELCA